MGGSSSLALEGDLEELVTTDKAVEGLDGVEGVLVAHHVDKGKALGFVGAGITDDLDVLDGSIRAKDTVQHGVVSFLGHVVDKQRPLLGRVSGCGDSRRVDGH